MGNIELDDIEGYRPPAYWRVKGQNPPTHFFKPPHRICKCNDHHPPERFPTNNAILAIPPCVTACPYCGFESFADDSLSGVIVRDHILRRHINRDPVFSNIEVQSGVILPSPEPSTQPSSTHVEAPKPHGQSKPIEEPKPRNTQISSELYASKAENWSAIKQCARPSLKILSFILAVHVVLSFLLFWALLATRVYQIIRQHGEESNDRRRTVTKKTSSRSSGKSWLW